MSRTPTVVRAGTLAMAILVTTLASGAGMTDPLSAAYAEARYEDARTALGQLVADEPDRPELQLWGQRLTTDPDRALELAVSQVRDRELPLAQRIHAALDGSAIALSRGDVEIAWGLLGPLLDVAPELVPGAVYLQAGRVGRLAGDPQRAREMLASVLPSDPSFLAARELLGRIGLENGNNELALRYFESAERHGGEDENPELLAGRWYALRLLGRDIEARELADQLEAKHAMTLAAMEVREERRRETEELSALADTLDTEAPEQLTKARANQYSVQLAAFRDRSLALQFVQRWQIDLPALRIERIADNLGQPVYKVQTGHFVSRAQARSEATRILRRHGLECFVAGDAN